MDRNQLAAVPVLLREVGLVEAVRLGWLLEKQKRAGEPFASLGPPVDEKDRLSREQIGPAILLYKELRNRRTAAEALRITQAVVIEGAVSFLKQSIGPLRSSDLEALDEAGRLEFVQERGEKFFNADVEWNEVRPDRVDFTVVHCRFPALCAATGVPELAMVFCAGDAKFFGTVEPNVQLVRDETIATGGETCPFSLRWVG